MPELNNEIPNILNTNSFHVIHYYKQFLLGSALPNYQLGKLLSLKTQVCPIKILLNPKRGILK